MLNACSGDNLLFRRLYDVSVLNWKMLLEQLLLLGIVRLRNTEVYK